MSLQVALYARVSSNKQTKEGTIDSQISTLKSFAKEHDYIIDEDLIFADNGISGATLIRPALDELRNRSNSGEVDAVLILCPDRLARKYTHQLILIEEFQRLGVEIIFSNREICSSPEDQLLLQIQGVISEYEREKIMERSRRGKLQKANKGVVSVLSGAPYGYIYISKNDAEEARYEIYDEEARIVKDIFYMYTYKKMSIGAISKNLNKNNIPTRKQIGIWERSTVWGILKNPAYAGKAAFRKTHTAESIRPTKLARDSLCYPSRAKSSSRSRDKKDWIYIPVPAIVEENIFEIAAQQLEENKKFSSRNNSKNQYLASGLLHCCRVSSNGYQYLG